MSYPVFYVPAGDVLPVFFDTFAGSTGASITMSGLAVTDIEIYKDGSTTQRSSDAGYTLLDTDGIDFDGLTGIHGFSIDTGDNTDSGFYTVGAWFTVVVSAITVDSQTVSFIACQFRLMAAEGVAGKPKADVDAFGGTAGTFSSGRPEVNTTHLAGTSQTARDIGASVLLSSGTGTGQVSLSSGRVLIQSGVQKGAALNKFQFTMVDTSGTLLTGLSVSGYVSKDGAAYSSLTDTVTEVANGTYEVDISSTEMNANNVALRFTATGAADRNVTIRTDP